jgi:sugar lactone lactonase YvrE
MSEPTVLLTGLGIPESPRWHEGRLWFCNWIDRQVVAVGLDGTPEVMSVRDPDTHPMAYSIDWLPDGRLLVTGDKLRRQEPDGSMVIHAEQRANEIVVDGRGNIYLNGADFNFVRGEAPKPGYIKLVTPDGKLRQVADDIQFPNGMIITPDNRTLIISESFAGQLTAFDIDPDGGLSNRRVFADGLSPDGICLDAEGAVWTSTGASGVVRVVRVAEGGEILQRVDLRENRAPFALMLGGPDRRTLFIMTAEWRKADGHVANLERLNTGPRTGEILTLPVDVPGAAGPDPDPATGVRAVPDPHTTIRLPYSAAPLASRTRSTGPARSHSDATSPYRRWPPAYGRRGASRAGLAVRFGGQAEQHLPGLPRVRYRMGIRDDRPDCHGGAQRGGQEHHRGRRRRAAGARRGPGHVG